MLRISVGKPIPTKNISVPHVHHVPDATSVGRQEEIVGEAKAKHQEHRE
jgi:hypothetical protein